MEIIGHFLINFKPFYKINSALELENFDNLIFEFNEDLVKEAIHKDKSFSIIVKNVSQIILSNAFGAKYIIINKDDEKLIKQAVELAEFYLFDSKIATIITDDKELENSVKNRLDSVIYENAIFQK